MTNTLTDKTEESGGKVFDSSVLQRGGCASDIGGPAKFATRRGRGLLTWLSHHSVVVSSDQATALGNVPKDSCAQRGADTKNMLESSPAYTSKARQVVEGQLRTLEPALES